MKNLFAFLLIVSFFGCQKEVAEKNVQPETETKVEEKNNCGFTKETFLSTNVLRLVTKKKGKPVDTTTTQATVPDVIFLDFDGHTVTNSVWNNSGPIVCAASGLSEDQQRQVLEGVAFDYQKIKVIVTRDSSVYWNADPKKRIRVVLTATYSWYGSTAGGVSYTGSFTWGNDTPCFVFTSLYNYYTVNIRKAASHEAGHTLGLRHHAKYDSNCNLLTSYNPDIDPTTGAYRIMGLPYGGDAAFGVGVTPYDCHTEQKDLEIMASVVGWK